MFFDSNSYFIDEKVNFFQFENNYKVYNGQGGEIGGIYQKISGWQKILRLLVKKSNLPFFFEIRQKTGSVVATISRGWTFWLSKTTVANEKGEVIAFIYQKFTFFKPEFHIHNAANQKIASISGDWMAWNFAIKNNQDQAVGSIDKKWAGAMKEIFTTADKYNVRIDESYPESNDKAAILSAAIAIDMILKESKQN
jgi:uncharacterized protein YxjI